MSVKYVFLMVISMLAFVAQPAFAQELDKGDTAWMMVSSLLVVLMIVPGLALFYGGLVRKENVLATLMQTFSTMCVVSLTWVVIGYSLVFTEGNSFVGGLDKLFLNGLAPDSLSGSIPESVFIFFQLTFAAITTALILGSVADRIRFTPMIIFGAVWSIVVYAPIAHMVWGPGGFFGGEGPFNLGHALDFADGTVVHINAGIAGLAAAIVLGKRKKRGNETHNLVFSMVGASLLWVGWFGFNAGSALSAGNSAGMAMLCTQVAASAGVLAWVFAEWSRRKKPSVLGALSGAIAGLVGITPAAGFVDVGSAIVIGITAGLVCYWVTYLFKAKFPIDDSLDVFSIHCAGGIVGALLTGIFAQEKLGGTPGWLEGNPDQFLAQLVAVVVTLIYSAVMTYVLFQIIRLFTRLRVHEAEEIKGLDISLHGEKVL